MLRHGQSEWNSLRRWQGTVDSPLTALGREQAYTTARLLASTGRVFGSLWSSDLKRASQTATIVGEVLGLGQPRTDTRLREAYAGEWQGMTPEEIEAAFPGWLASHRRPPSFEAYTSVVARASEALADVARHAVSCETPSAIVVAHSGLVRSLVRHLGRQDERIPNLGGVWFTASVVDGRAELAVADMFDPRGIVVSGVDAPGEDPGD